MTKAGRWWGADQEAREQADIDLVISNNRRGGLLVGECKWRTSFDGTEAARKLMHRTGLIGSYTSTNHTLFSKRAIGQATREKLGEDGMFVGAAQLYEG